MGHNFERHKLEPSNDLCDVALIYSCLIVAGLHIHTFPYTDSKISIHFKHSHYLSGII